MGEVLSQNEIDDLLDALNSGIVDAEEIKLAGTIDEHQVKKYDFARPSKFAKEQLRTLQMMFENYVRLLSTTFTVFFRTSTEAEIISVEAVVYQEFTNSLPNPAILGIVDFSPLKGSIILELSSKIGYAIIDKLLGGQGDVLERVREFTDIEKAILEKILARCGNLLKEPWENVIELTPELEKIETNPQYAQIVSSNEMVALITISVKIGEVEGLMNICLPYMVIEPVMSKLNKNFWFSNLQKNEVGNYNQIIERKLENTMINCRAELGKSTITVGDFVNLQEGDVITLDNGVDSTINLYVGNKMKYYGKPGLVNNHNAIQVCGYTREEDL